MNFKEIHELFSNPENIKQQVLHGQVFTDEAIINICEEYNKDKSKFSPKRFNTKQVIKNYHRIVEKVEKNIAKELDLLLKESGLTLEEYESFTLFEKAQLKLLFEQNMYLKSMTRMTGWNTISNGLDKF